MADVDDGGRRRASPWRMAPWVVATLLLLLPAVAMQFTSEVDWDETDFIIMGILLYGCCGLFELTARLTRNNAYRAGVAVAVLGSFFLTWINLAVGIIGSENNPANQMFFGVIAIGMIGAPIVSFKAVGMSRVLTVMAIAQGLTAVAAMVMGHFTWVLAAFFVALWLGSAALFRKAAQDQTADAAAS